MFTNFFKVTIRNLYREKIYAIINISGLALAIACCLILGLYLKSELTYDRHNTKHKQIFRVLNEYNTNGKIDAVAVTSMSLGPMLAEEHPEIQGFVRLRSVPQEQLFRHEEKAFYWKNIYIADDNIFDIFTHKILYGDPKTALVDPTSVAVSESFAKKYFGDTNPIGETISNDEGTFKITLVFADLPENSHLRYDLLFSYNTEELAEPTSLTRRHRRLWKAINNYTYLLMHESYDVMDFKKISDSFYERHMAEIGKTINATWRCWLQPLADIHLYSDVRSDLPTGNRLYVFGFAAVAIFILLVASINYMNLATAQAAERAKEVGMRKILGAGRIHLILIFMGESIFFSMSALFLGLVLVEIALNLTPINELLGKALSLNLIREPGLFGWMLMLSLVIGVMSGVYPSVYFSSIQPLAPIVSGNRAIKGNIRIRESLVLIQFIITVTVIACTLLMGLQTRYFSHKSLGFDNENMLIITLRGSDLIDKIPTIRKELAKNSSILGISESSDIIGQRPSNLVSWIDDNDGAMETTVLRHMSIGDDFIEVMGMELVAGRDFSKKLLTDTDTKFVVNESMVDKMGWAEPLGKRIQMGRYNGSVIGVVKDFNFVSLHSQIEPIAMHGFVDLNEEDSSMERFLVLKISEKEIARTLDFIEEKITKFDPIHPFEYEFLNEFLDKLYMTEQHLMRLFEILAGICILISCMGIFGLSAFTTEQRTKEIGIRKVLGASTWQIIIMLARKILFLVLGGAVIASLAAYYAMDEWLTSFAYRIGINPFVFVISAIMAAAVAFITVALQSYKTARTNPVNTLRYE